MRASTFPIGKFLASTKDVFLVFVKGSKGLSEKRNHCSLSNMPNI